MTPFIPGLPSSGAAPKATTDTFLELATWLDDRLAKFGVPGTALGVIVGGQRFTHCHGVVDTTTGAAVTPATAFRIASLTKIFTASAIAHLAHAGRIDIADPVVTCLPDFRVADADTSRATAFAHLLSHSAGWADDLEPDGEHEDLGWYVGQMRDLPQVAPLGTLLNYSNSGYLLAGHLLATITGERYEDVIHSTVLDPLGLGSTDFVSADVGTGQIARGHTMGDNGPEPVEADAVPRAAHPAYGLRTSVDDLLGFLDAHLQAAHDPASPLTGMLLPLGPGGSVGPTRVDHIGMGWMLRDIGGHRVAMSQGSDGGFCASMAFAPDDGVGIVLLTNSDATLLLVNDLLWEGFSRFLGAREPDVSPIDIDANAIAAATGTFALWDGMAFAVSAADGRLNLATSVGGHPLTDLSGPLAMTSPVTGFVEAMGGRVWFDLVPGDAGSIDWVRFAGRLASRTSRTIERP